MNGFPFEAACTDGGQDDLRLLRSIFEQRLGGGGRSERSARIPAARRTDLIDRFCELLRQLSALMRVSAGADGEMSLESVLKRLVGVTTEALGAERSTLFLYDRETDELFSSIAEGTAGREIRFAASRGIAGTVFRSGMPIAIGDAYWDPRFNPEIDEHTGYHTRSVLCVPVCDWDNRVIGVMEVLNKRLGPFDREDQSLLQVLTGHAASALEAMQLRESVEKALYDEAQLLGVTTALSSELDLDALLDKIMVIATDLLDADRSTLFLHDEATHTLRSKIAGGLGTEGIRIPADTGIAGSVFVHGEIVNIPDVYLDPRFNREVDRVTGYRTRSILCAPVATHSGKRIGIIQVLNKRGGPFSVRDERRLRALSSQAAVAIENARLFEEVRNAHNYSESILKSLSNGVVTLDSRRRIIKANDAALRILRRSMDEIAGAFAGDMFADLNPWIVEALDKVQGQRGPEIALDIAIHVPDDDPVPVNLMVEPLVDVKERPIGFLLIIEDITREKRIKSTMARYMSQELSERLLETGETILGGQAQEVTVLFSDISNFTGLTEHLGARATVSLLNAYFPEMVDLVLQNGGILDKYIGDAIMAVFGTPFPGRDDAENAVAVAVKMARSLRGFNRQRLLRGEDPIGIRLGISTGEVIVGNIGSPRRMDYTVIGHNVNVASRLEGANKFYGTKILITESTLTGLRNPYQVRELDLIRVKGSHRPVAIYEVLDGREEREYPDPQALIARFSEGLGLYRRRRWAEAAACFSEALRAAPGDGPSRLFLERCAHYRMAPPPDDWNGVWVMTEK